MVHETCWTGRELSSFFFEAEATDVIMSGNATVS